MFNQRLRTRLAHAAGLIAATLAAQALAAAPTPSRASAQAVNPWGVPYTDIEPDPAVRFGRLPNGMRYAIRRNSTPKGTASVRLHFSFGSIAESERERGLAHFIEHMAFNGSTNVPEGEMRKILERQGLAFGPDTNASTSFEETIYQLELPQTNEARLDTAFFLLREVASEVKFDPAAVDRERGIILSERRARDNYQLRRAVQNLRFHYPLTPYADRLPIGTDEVLRAASASTLADLYRRYYRPENATLVFVGDADPALIERKIRQKFIDWSGQQQPGAKLERGRLDLGRSADFETFIDPAVETSVSLSVLRPWEDPADTRSARRRQIVRSTAIALLSRRLQLIADSPDAKLISAGASNTPSRDVAWTFNVSAAVRDGEWKAGLETLEQELRRALKYGFTPSELKVQLAESDGALKRAAERASTRRSPELAAAILAVIDDNDFITTPEFRYDFFKAVAPTIAVEEVNAEIRRLWSGSRPLVFVTDKRPIDEAEIAAVMNASRQVAVAEPKQAGDIQFAYNDFGPAGTIVADRRIEDLGVRTIRFANNVRLNIKKTDYEKGSVRYSVRIAGGTLALPQDKPGLGMMISSLSAISALEKHSLEDIRQIFAGHNVQSGIGVGDDMFGIQGATSSADLPLQMKLTAAFLTAPGYRREAANRWSALMPVFEAQRRATAQAVAAYEVPRIIADDDPRFGVPETSILSQRTLEEARLALAPLFASAPIEIGLVGDVDEATAIETVARTFGALPTRAAESPAYAEQRRARVRGAGSPITLKHKGPADQSIVMNVWPATDDDDYPLLVRLDLLTDVLGLMLTEKLREELGETYSPSVGVNASDVFEDFGYISVGATVAPDKIKVVEDAIAEVITDFRNKPIDADLLARALNPALERVDRSMRENSYWLDRIAVAQTEPEKLERIRKRRSLYLSVKPEELQRLARQYLSVDKKLSIRIVSEQATLAQQ